MHNLKGLILLFHWHFVMLKNIWNLWAIGLVGFGKLYIIERLGTWGNEIFPVGNQIIQRQSNPYGYSIFLSVHKNQQICLCKGKEWLRGSSGFIVTWCIYPPAAQCSGQWHCSSKAGVASRWLFSACITWRGYTGPVRARASEELKYYSEEERVWRHYHREG